MTRTADRQLAEMIRLARATGARMQQSTAAAGRPQPQTTAQPQGGPFVRHAQPGRLQQYDVTAQAFGAVVNPPLTSMPGYLQRTRLLIAATGGSASGAVSAQPDAPESCVALVQVTDPFGTPIITGPGYEMLRLVQKYGGQFGALAGMSDTHQLPSYKAMTTPSGVSAGNFQFATCLPYECVKGVGCISGANAALQRKVTLTLAQSSAVYATAPGTVPTMEFITEEDFYWLPDAATDPPALGTTEQWTFAPCNPGIGSASNTGVTFPKLGGYISTIILELRDSTGARIDGYGTRLRWGVDGVTLMDTRFTTLVDDMADAYGFQAGVTGAPSRDTGVVVISRKTSLGRQILGLLDSGETLMSTTPGTGMTLECDPWGTIANAPAVLNVIIGVIIPVGPLVTGLPEA